MFLYDFGKDKYEGYAGLCFDAISANLKPVKLVVPSGKATISVSGISEYDLYTVTIILDDVSFQTPDKNFVPLKRVEIKNARVGWSPG